MKHTRQDLNIMQGWSLEEKIKVSQMKILEWYRAYSGQVFTSFSGGKDSTVLLDLARQVCPDSPGPGPAAPDCLYPIPDYQPVLYVVPMAGGR